MKTNSRNRMISLLLCFSMLCAIVLPALPANVQAADDVYAWDNGNIADYVHYTGETSYLDDAPFGYAYFYQGTDPSDTRAAGFYDMILAVNGGNSWFKDRYYCGATDAETEYVGRTAAIHMAAQTWPTYHYSTGYVFTAPYTGTVQFTYQYACVNSNAVNYPIYIMPETATSYSDALHKLTATKTVSTTDKTASAYDEITFTVEMTAGEKIYFVADSDASNRAFGHWISAVRYLPAVEAMTTDKTAYMAGDSITVTTAISGGVFGANDYIAVIAEGETEPVVKQAAAETVTFDGGISAGNYQIVLSVDGIDGYAASTDIEISSQSWESWDNGNIVDYVHYTGETSYLDDAPFGYAYFFQGTDPNDTRAAGFYDMILAVNGGNDWFKNRYYCGATDAETEYVGRTAAIHMAAQTWPTYHYSTGYVFTAPYTGTVQFTYQYACVNSNAVNYPIYIMPETATSYSDALHKLTATKTVSTTDKTASAYDEITFTVEMTAGEKIYFVADSDASNRAFGHWISAVRYLPVVEALNTDKAVYTAGDSITVTTATSGGTYGVNDYIAIIPEGKSSPAAKLAAAETVTFTQQLPAGKYQVALVVDGIDGYAASAAIEITSKSWETWDNGNIVDYVHYTGEKAYLDDAPFGYAYFYQGTDPNDTRAAGFYDMILAVNGGDSWFKNRYYCGATDAETEYNARTAAMHMAAVTYPTYHYSTGYVFTAPYTGTVEFTYQYAAVNSSAVGMPFYVMRENATGYGDALQKLTATKVADVNDKTVSEYDEITFAVEMTAGEKIYFVADSDASSKAFGHWISAVRYLPVVQSMIVDQESYTSGDSIAVTTTTSGGTFGANDYIAIFAKGENEPVAKKAAATFVTFDQWLVAGEYEIALVNDGVEGYIASTEIQVAAAYGGPWDNGNIVDYVHYTGEKNYLSDKAFGYAYFYQGTDPSDTRAAGFYDMILAVNGGDSWFKDRYYCGATDAETEYNARTAAIHMAAVTYPTYHYSTGYVFTAPYDGAVTFTYQYAAVNDSAVGMPFYVMRETATGYSDAIKTFTAAKKANVNDKTASEYDEAIFMIKVTAGEKIYFVADSDASSKAFAHWISAVEYCGHTNESSYDVAPTLGDKGYTQVVCADCGEELYTKDEVASLARVDSWSLTLGSNLGVNFRFAIDDSVRETAQISITVGGGDPVVYSVMNDAVMDDSTSAEDPYYLVTVHVSAAQMQDEIKVQILNGEETTDVKSYTVESYARTVLADEEMSQYHQLLKDMLNYGAAAQVYFQYNHEGTLPNADIAGFGDTAIPTEAVTQQIAAGTVDGIRFYGATLVYRDNIAVRLYFVLTAGNIEDYTFEAGSDTLTPVCKDAQNGLYYVEFVNILPNELDAAVTCCVRQADQSLQVQYAPLDYIIRMNNKVSSSDVLKTLLKALYNYHLSAYALVGAGS